MLAGSLLAQSVTKVELAKDNGHGKPGAVVKGFAPSDNPLHCVVYLKPLSGPTVFSASLIAVNAGNRRDFNVATTNISGIAGSQSIDFKFSLQNPWPVGSYRISLKSGTKTLDNVAFDVKVVGLGKEVSAIGQR